MTMMTTMMRMMQKYSGTLLLFTIFTPVVLAQERSDYLALTKSILSTYSSKVRPNCEANNGSIKVTVDIGLRQVLELNEQEQVLDSNVWLRFKWHDCNLSWNISEYNGIKSIVVPESMIWIPDICLYDNSEYVLKGIKEYYRVRIYPDGFVRYSFPSVLKSVCLIDIKHFPFDQQECNLTFGSWAYTDNEVMVTSVTTEGDLKNYVKSSEWKLTEMVVSAYQKLYPCCKYTYSEVVFTIRLSRKPAIQLLNLIYPCMIISGITLIGFFLPPESGEKVSVSVTVLLSLAVFQLVITENLPPNSDSLPYLGFFFLANMVFVGLCCFMSVIVMNIFYSGERNKRIPDWIRFIFFECLAKLLCYPVNDKIVYTISQPIGCGHAGAPPLMLPSFPQPYFCGCF